MLHDIRLQLYVSILMFLCIYTVFHN